MQGYIEEMNIVNPVNNVEMNIKLNGKNLILTGRNGSGKTRVINKIYEKIKTYLQGSHNRPEAIKQNINNYKNLLKNYNYDVNTIRQYKAQLESYEENLKNSLYSQNFAEYEDFYKQGKSLLCLFNAVRQANIQQTTAIKSVDSFKKSAPVNISNSSQGSNFENYLSAMKVYQSLELSEKKNIEEKKRVDKWFKKIENDLKKLFEDDTTKIEFDTKTLGFTIHQKGKVSYDFRGLSSGISAIMDIYTDLLMKVTLKDIEPDEISGVVLIDEIDAHLHVSLQKKILRFFCKAFPKIQFIVATHSPFVITSVDDAVIYDLSKNEEVEDLSAYSYEAVMEGLFDVLPISHITEEKIIKLGKYNAKEKLTKKDLENVSVLISELSENKDKLDAESRYYLSIAEVRLSKEKGKRDV